MDTRRDASALMILALCWLYAAAMPMTASAQSARGTAPKRAVICESCHGTKSEGLSALNAPRLAGLASWYIEIQLRNFKAGIRGGPGSDDSAAAMGRIAGTLATDTDTHEVAEYFASMPLPAAAPRSLSGSADQGKAAFQQCAACHGADGTGNRQLEAPPLRGANDWYVVRQLKAFHDGRRGKDPRDTSGQAMRAIAQTIANDAAINDLAAYIQTLR
jgi:cytochrome c553